MGFSDCEDIEPTEEIELTESEISNPGGIEKVVRFVKFQRVTSLSIFVEEVRRGFMLKRGSVDTSVCLVFSERL